MESPTSSLLPGRHRHRQRDLQTSGLPRLETRGRQHSRLGHLQLRRLHFPTPPLPTLPPHIRRSPLGESFPHAWNPRDLGQISTSVIERT